MKHTVVYGANATPLERNACEDLKADLERVVGVPVALHEESAGNRDEGAVYLVGTPASCGWVSMLADRGEIEISRDMPGSQGGIMKRIERPGLGPLVVLAGSDAKGAQNVVYDFSRDVLGVDPYQYFTDYSPALRPEFLPKTLDRTVAPPKVPILCYFDNDDDELANMTQPYLQFDKATWKGVLDTLARTRYNAIDLHDHLGRSEFFLWEDYIKLRPDYHTDLELLDWVIDYAHSKGIMVQIPMYLAWEFKHITEEEGVCWSKYKHRWIETWQYYMKDSPIGKADLFLDRPRSQIWDCQYKSACGEDTGAVMTEAFTALRDVVLEHNPRATLLCDLYAHGQDLWTSGAFRPPKDYILLWPNNGWGLFKPFPKDKRGYRFGTYMHAGFWLNHVVQDPYPRRIEQSMKELLLTHEAAEYCLVNGQTFRHFILNLEAYSRATYAPESFDGDAFFRQWAARYFGDAAAPHVVRAFDLLHEVSGEGYVRLIHEVVAAEKACLAKEVPADLAALEKSVKDTEARLETLRAALQEAEQADQAAKDQAHFCHDHVVLPIRVFAETVALHLELQKALLAWGRDTSTENANAHLREAARILRAHLKTREDGDKNPMWKTWYDPKKRRPNGGFPDLGKLEAARF
ncbi:MAG: glycosyl hydrolase 115 family protein [Candidatus Hydrogenedentes bacterium]|nr:glycosyl hydrolase 115 family protein [Candidatus Hydrogenedentota bacterium]